jgi:hypothetical protein
MVANMDTCPKATLVIGNPSLKGTNSGMKLTIRL